MKKTVVLIVLGVLSVGIVGGVMGSGDHEGREHEGREHKERSERESEGGVFRGGWFESRADVTPVANASYKSECSGCHFAYQPGLLPAAAWKQVMASLSDHYGDDASMDEQLAQEITAYLTGNAADGAAQSRSRAFAKGAMGGKGLPRITETQYFRREHHEIPAKYVTGNAEVGSFSNCNACHTKADSGVFNEHQVVIPGVGRWDD